MIRSCPVKPNATDCNLRSFLAIPTATHPLILADNSIRTQTRWESHRKSHRQTCAYQRTIHPDLFTLACRLLLRICCGCLPAVSATRPRLGKYGGLGPNFTKCPGGARGGYWQVEGKQLGCSSWSLGRFATALRSVSFEPGGWGPSLGISAGPTGREASLGLPHPSHVLCWARHMAARAYKGERLVTPGARTRPIGLHPVFRPTRSSVRLAVLAASLVES